MRELLFSVTKKDFRIDTFRAGGPGGQNQNKRETGVRITHLESGASAESRTHRTQGQNKKAALERLVQTPKWKTWHRIKTAQMLGQVTMTEEYITADDAALRISGCRNQGRERKVDR